MKKVIAVLLATLYLTSFGAFAADDAHKCKPGKVWDETKHECVKEVKK